MEVAQNTYENGVEEHLCHTGPGNRTAAAGTLGGSQHSTEGLAQSPESRCVHLDWTRGAGEETAAERCWSRQPLRVEGSRTRTLR